MVLITTSATPGGEPLGVAEMNPFLNTPSSTVSSSTISSLPTTVTSATKCLAAPPAFAFSDYSDSIPSVPCTINRSSSTGSHASYASSAGLSSAIERFARTPPPRLRMDDLMSATSSVCGTPVVAPETLAIPVVCEGLSLVVGSTNPDDEDEDVVEVISMPQPIPDEPEDYDSEEDRISLKEFCHRRSHKRRQTLQNMMWSISGESNSVEMQIDDTPLLHLEDRSRLSHDVGNGEIDFDDDALFYVEGSNIDEDASTIVYHEDGLDPDAEEIEVFTPNTNYELPLCDDIDELDSPVLTKIPDYISPTDESFRRALVTSDVGFESDSVEIVYLDREVYIDHFEDTPRTTASEEMRRMRRENYDKTFRYNEGYPAMECYLMKHYMSLVHEHMIAQPPSPIFRSLSFDDDANSRPQTDYEDDESERFSESNDITLRLDTFMLHR